KGAWSRGPATNNHLITAATYYYEVYARNGFVNMDTGAQGGPHIVTAASPTGSGETVTIPPPTEFHGIGISQTEIQWIWKDNATDEAGFHIYERNDSGNLIVRLTPGFSIPQTDTPIMNAVESGLPTPNTAVTRYITSFNENGDSLLVGPATSWTGAGDPIV